MVTQALIDAANNAGGKDNITVVFVEGDRFEPKFAVARRPLARCRSLAGVWVVPFSQAARLFLVLGVLADGADRLRAQTPLENHTRRRETRLSVPYANLRTWRVNSDISDAIHNARSGDTVIVAPGQYHEQIILKDGVSLTASSRVRPKSGQPESPYRPTTSTAAVS